MTKPGGGVGERINAGALYGRLYEVIDGVGIEGADDGLITGRHGPEHWPGADAGEFGPGMQRPHRAADRVGLDGHHHELGLRALLVGLGPRNGDEIGREPDLGQVTSGRYG